MSSADTDVVCKNAIVEPAMLRDDTYVHRSFTTKIQSDRHGGLAFSIPTLQTLENLLLKSDKGTRLTNVNNETSGTHLLTT